jgi:7-keto-8-aminopelargonate synthetase-like enzyme
MDGDFAPLKELSELGRRYGAMGFVDEAHAIGVWGEGGKGVRGGAWDIVVGTLSKSLGSQGGFVTGSRELIDTLLNKARSFIYTTGLSPVCIAAARTALSVMQDDPALRSRVQRLAARLREGFRQQGWDLLRSESHIVPILLGSADRALACADHLQKGGIYAPAIRPPTVPAGECRIRFSVTAEHSDEDIETLLTVLDTYKEKR